ncbi:MAG: Na/Pi cotransporter family protein [Luteibaculaceae bacterium]
MAQFDYWMFFAGLGVFMFGMFQLETGLKGLAGDSFKNLLKRFTNKSWKGVVTGTFVTAILQSSSLVTLLVLAFLGGGILSLQNSLGVVLGANLGTTVTAWVVATLGFKVNISAMSFPMLALGTLSYLMLDTRPFLKNMGSFLMGFGLLFLGLDFMKLSIEAMADTLDLSQFASIGNWFFLLLGLVITALIQSSSATIVIVLSALSAQLIDLPQATSIIIGANVGTTSTLIIGSLGGSADKKRLSYGNVIFKVVAGLVTFLLLYPLIDFTKNVMQITEPLMQLVFLNTIINVLGILLFFPFLKPFGRWLNTKFLTAEPTQICVHAKPSTLAVPDVAIEAFAKELKLASEKTALFIETSLFGLVQSREKSPLGPLKNMLRKEISPMLGYQELKTIENELIAFYGKIQEKSLTEVESAKLSELLFRLRSLVLSAKNIKDVLSNIEELRGSENSFSKSLLPKIATLYSELFYRDSEGFLKVKPFAKETVERFYLENITYIQSHAKDFDSSSISTINNLLRKTTLAFKEFFNAIFVVEEQEEIV